MIRFGWQITAVVLAVFATASEPAERGTARQVEPSAYPERIVIEHIGVDLPIVHAAWDGTAVARIDRCEGAIIIHDTATHADGILVLAAHRTSCGRHGFGGVQSLRNGDLVLLDGHPLTVFDRRYGRYHDDLWGHISGWPDHTAVALQTSLPGSRVVWQLLTSN